MAFGGFDRNSGPSVPPRGQPQFGNFRPSSPSPPPPLSPFNNSPSPRPTVFSPRWHDDPMAFLGDSNSQTQQGPFSVGPYVSSRSGGTSISPRPANFQDPRRTRSPPSGNKLYLENDTRDALGRPTVFSPRWHNDPMAFLGDSNSQTQQGPSSVSPYVSSRSGATSISPRPANFQDQRRTRSPPYGNKLYLENDTRDAFGRGQGASQRVRSPPEDFTSNSNVEEPRPPFRDPRRWQAQSTNSQVPKRSRSPPLQSANEANWRNPHPTLGDTDRVLVAPPKFGNAPTLLVKNSDSPVQQQSSPFSPHNEAEGVGSKIMNSQVPKRNRSLALAYDQEFLRGTNSSPQDDIEREVQAKAKRLARFGVELSQPVERNQDQTKHKLSASRHDQASSGRRKFIADQPIEAAVDSMLPDYEGLESPAVIAGLCPDMCPESERLERERKGDLDRYERLDGDRNQTSKALAVKKYNRTAEREADLIRPMPVLQQTIDYLLALLDQPYDDKFLSMYNFLWDRMRAIRMDLRMQHIFNQDAITMLEQMIRLHIIAMHELCEHTKGEGFSEGFDAHLNIEQMNKTSVELFQMYDDHRKRGSILVSEKEFRGYYALLKLDKHPGYKVEPAELSLDLAKMTPEIRQTPEILFARDVARACRTGNFIAFFRLARKASYLEACLMHAHFAKLRTQALASLHSGLQNTQGIPISHVTKWLGMEEEDIEALVEYHGFLIKEFEESYMVKDGPFLNSDKDYPTKCSRLVHLKKSRTIINDVSTCNQLLWSAEESKDIFRDKIVEPDSRAIDFVKSRTSVDVVDEAMLISEEDHDRIDESQVQPILEVSLPDQRFNSYHQVPAVWAVQSPQQSPRSAAPKVGKMSKPAQEMLRNDSLERARLSNLQVPPLEIETERDQQNERSEGSFFGSWVENSATQMVVIPQDNDRTLTVHQDLEDEEATTDPQETENEEEIMMAQQDNEVAAAKLKLILRKWKRLSSKRKELREQRQLAAVAALNSLTLGPPIQKSTSPPSNVHELDIDFVMRKRCERHLNSWSRLNISEEVGETLSERNPEAKCLCWKLLVCSQLNVTEGDRSVETSQKNKLASLWLRHKLMGVRKDNEDELVVPSVDLSIWKKWVTHQHDYSPICCFSVIREVKFNSLDDTLSGVGALMFLVSDIIGLDVQKAQLHHLVMSLPKDCSVPLLILCGNQKEGSLDPSTLANSLDLHHVDKTRISSFSVDYLAENQRPEQLDGFFSTERLRDGLRWLASQCPIQPVVHCIKTHELVMDHLSSSLEVLENPSVSVEGPNQCISAFNEALESSATEVATAAEANPSSWPCFEMTLLESSTERSTIESYLPNVGWSSAVTVEPILSRIQGCKLPFFEEDLSWLKMGSDMGEEILHKKSELENCLIRYLTDSSKMMEMSLATTEVSVILQKGAMLELHGSRYHIKPKWAAIFRRIFNWRLMNLSHGMCSMAYVLKHGRNVITPIKSGVAEVDMGASSLHDSDIAELEWFGSQPCLFDQPSLDEMVGVCYSTSQFGRQRSKPEAIQTLSRIIDFGEEASHADMRSANIQNDENHQKEVEFTKTTDACLFENISRSCEDYPSREVVLANKAITREADKLSRLLEQCNVVQNKIDEKLSIYF